MRRVLFLICLLLTAIGARAQEKAEQVLVFRNTGEVNLFFTDSLQCIEFSHFDADSLEHDEIVSQVFRTADTTMFVPLCEIDSVAFGPRNEVVWKENVHNLQDEGTQWIIRYDGQCVYYKQETPPDILPKKGDKLFCGVQDELFPTGLIARVDAVALQGGEYAVSVTDVGISEVFDRLFYAGRTNVEMRRKPSRPGKPCLPPVKADLTVGPITLSGSYEFDADLDVVVQPLRGYYYLSMNGTSTFEGRIEGKADNSVKAEGKKEITGVPLGVYALVFTPALRFDAFLDIEASASGFIGVKRVVQHHLKFEKRFGKDPVLETTSADDKDVQVKDSVQAGLTLCGSIYGGVLNTLDFNILRETAGARLKLKVGPCFSGEFDVGVLKEASGKAYNADAYAKFVLGTCARIGVEGSVYHRSFPWGGEEEYNLFDFNLDLFKREIDLFPIFAQPVAVSEAGSKRSKPENGTISASVKTETELPYDLDLDFEIVDANDEPIASIDAGTLEMDGDSLQGVAATFEDVDLKGHDVKEVFVRPVFNYGGYKVKAQNIGVKSDMQVQPAVFAMGNGAFTVLSGYPYAGQATQGDAHYQAGPYLPVPVTDTVFVKNPNAPGSGDYLPEEKTDNLIGVWQGTENGKEVTYTFNDDETGSLEAEGNVRSFTFHLNQPQSGEVLLEWTDGDGAMVLKALQISDVKLQYSLTGSPETYVLNRIR